MTHSPNNWDLQIDPSVVKDFKRLQKYDAQNLTEVIRLLPTNPYFGDIQKIKGSVGVWRRRAGSFRIFYKIMIAEKTILVFRMERRKSNTY